MNKTLKIHFSDGSAHDFYFVTLEAAKEALDTINEAAENADEFAVFDFNGEWNGKASIKVSEVLYAHVDS